MTFTTSHKVSSSRSSKTAARAEPVAPQVAAAKLVDTAPVLLVERLELDHLGVEAPRQDRVGIVHVGDTARHPGGEVAPGGAEDEHGAPRHVLTTVVAHPLDDGEGAGVAHAEALADLSGYEGSARGRPVEHDVARDDLLLGPKRRGLGRSQHDDPPREALCRDSRWRPRQGSS